jgi:hypothetical protein
LFDGFPNDLNAAEFVSMLKTCIENGTHNAVRDCRDLHRYMNHVMNQALEVEAYELCSALHKLWAVILTTHDFKYISDKIREHEASFEKTSD